VTASILKPDGSKCPSSNVEKRILKYGEFWDEYTYFGLVRIARAALSSWLESKNYFGQKELWKINDEDKVVVCETEQVERSAVVRFLFCPRIIEDGTVVAIKKGCWVYVDTNTNQVVDIKKEE
jgi:hypothetical protein